MFGVLLPKFVQVEPSVWSVCVALMVRAS